MTVIAKPCPICGAAPDVDRCAPDSHGKVWGWYAGCYGRQPFEHWVGANGDTREEAIASYNDEVAREARAHAEVEKILSE